jgi:hypothetical protein
LMLDIGKWAKNPATARQAQRCENKRTIEREAALREVAAQIEKSVDGAFKGDWTSLGNKRAESAG